jgi:hypothetical protein
MRYELRPKMLSINFLGFLNNQTEHQLISFKYKSERIKSEKEKKENIYIYIYIKKD